MKNILKRAINDQISSFNGVFYVQWHITNLCTENCKHCYLDKYSTENIFDYNTSIKMIDQIYNIAKQKKVPCYIAFTGGDPLLNNNLFSLIEYAQLKDIKVSIKGNPWHLTNNILKELSSLNIKSYHLSIDGLEKTHDYIRKKGSYMYTINALKKLKKYGIKTLVKYTISSINKDEIIPTIQILNDMGVNFFDFARFCPTSKDDSMFTLSSGEYRKLLIDILKCYQNLKLQKGKLQILFRDHLWLRLFYELNLFEDKELYIIDNKFKSGCSMGNNNSIVMNFNGDIHPCAKVSSYILGNIQEDSLHSILQKNEFVKFSEVNSYKGCSDCNLIYYCRGCPALSYSINGDIFSKDPNCWKSEKNIL